MDSLGTVSYIWVGLYTCRFAHGPWSVRCTLLIIDGVIAYHPIRCRALWESVERPWESPEMSGPMGEVGLWTAGTIVPDKGWD